MNMNRATSQNLASPAYQKQFGCTAPRWLSSAMRRGKGRLVGALLFSTLMSACAMTAEQQADLNQFEQRMAAVSVETNETVINLLVPECLKSLQGQEIDEAKLFELGFKETKPLLSSTTIFERLNSAAGIGKFRDADVISPTLDGGCDISTRFITTNGFDESIDLLMQQMGFQKLQEGGGFMGRDPVRRQSFSEI